MTKKEKIIDDTIGHWLKNEEKLEGATKLIHNIDEVAQLNNGETILYGGSQCPLCDEYVCNTCPITNNTTIRGCSDTPWVMVRDASTFAEFKKEVHAEVDFLIAVLI